MLQNYGGYTFAEAFNIAPQPTPVYNNSYVTVSNTMFYIFRTSILISTFLREVGEEDKTTATIILSIFI